MFVSLTLTPPLRNEGFEMFASHCTTTNSGVLLSESSIVAFHRAPGGLQVELECHCGEHVRVLVNR